MPRKHRAGDAPKSEAAASTLWPLKDLRHYTIGSPDGDIGQVADAYFDDQSWTVRYLVVDTGTWLPGRKVLVSPSAVERVDAPGARLVTTLSRQQVKDSPGIDTDKPVSRQHETTFHEHYGYPLYWTGPYRWGAMPYPMMVGMPPAAPPNAVDEEMRARALENADPNLRSAEEVSGYGIRARDGDLGHVEDFLIDAQSWAIRYLVVDPASWWPGPHVIIPPAWVTRVDWDDSKVETDVSRQQVRDAPEYRPASEMARDYERALHHHYGRRGYWEDEPGGWLRRPPAA